MKITKTQLKRIIKEELGAMRENDEEYSAKDRAWDAIEKNSPMSAEDVRSIVSYAIDAASEGDVAGAYESINQYFHDPAAEGGGSEWYSDEYETIADRKFADR
jgi:hypothetical protein